AFGNANRHDLLQRIANDDPVPTRRINAKIPVELETIIQKAIEKEPHSRYATAGALADDLRRFLDEKPIKARPATTLDHFRKWSRRNRALVRSGLIVVTLTAILLTVAGIWVDHARQQTRLEQQARAADQSQAATSLEHERQRASLEQRARAAEHEVAAAAYES